MPDTAPPQSLLATLALYILTPLAMNAAIFSLGWDSPGPPNPMLPPGWAVGSIWMLLFAAMGAARWLARRVSPPAARWLDALAFLCLIYPLYTLGLSSDRIGLAGAIVTAILAVIAIAQLRRASKLAALLTSAVLLWLLYAGAALAVGLHRAI